MSILARKHHRAVGELAVLHAREQVEVLRHAAVAVRAVLAGLRQRAAIFAHLLRRQVVHIGQALVDQLHCIAVQRVEIIRCPVHLAVPLEAQPAHVLLDGQRVFLALLLRVGVVETQVALAVVVLCQPEVEADGFGVADVQVAVRLRRETGDDALVFAGGQIAIDDGADEIGNGCGDGGVAAHDLFEKVSAMKVRDFTRNPPRTNDHFSTQANRVSPRLLW